MTSDWIGMTLDVPAASWETSLRFWSAATHCSAATSPGHRATLVPEAGDPWVVLRAGEQAPRVRLQVDTDDRELERSPGGLRVAAAAGGSSSLARRPDSVLDQVCLDIPGPRWETEVEFWRRLTGRGLEQGRRPEFAFLGPGEPDASARILLQRLDSDDGPVRAHPDFAVADREAATARHVSLGARAGESFDDWTVLTAPDGTVYCLTDRDPLSGWVSRR